MVTKNKSLINNTYVIYKWLYRGSFTVVTTNIKCYKLTFQSPLARIDCRPNLYNMFLYCLILLQDPQDENMSGTLFTLSTDIPVGSPNQAHWTVLHNAFLSLYNECHGIVLRLYCW